MRPSRIPLTRGRPDLVLATLAVVTALLFIAMAIHASPLDPAIPVIQLTFSETAFRAILSAWQDTGVARFKAHFAIDFPFLLSYGLLGFVLATRSRLLQSFAPPVRSLLALTLPLAALADASENLLHLFLLFAAGPFSPALYALAGSAASIKWLLIVCFVALSAASLRRCAARGGRH